MEALYALLSGVVCLAFSLNIVLISILNEDCVYAPPLVMVSLGAVMLMVSELNPSWGLSLNWFRYHQRRVRDAEKAQDRELAVFHQTERADGSPKRTKWERLIYFGVAWILITLSFIASNTMRTSDGSKSLGYAAGIAMPLIGQVLVLGAYFSMHELSRFEFFRGDFDQDPDLAKRATFVSWAEATINKTTLIYGVGMLFYFIPIGLEHHHGAWSLVGFAIGTLAFRDYARHQLGNTTGPHEVWFAATITLMSWLLIAFNLGTINCASVV